MVVLQFSLPVLEPQLHVLVLRDFARLLVQEPLLQFLELAVLALELQGCFSGVLLVPLLLRSVLCCLLDDLLRLLLLLEQHVAYLAVLGLAPFSLGRKHLLK